MRVAIIGCGFIGNVHAQAVKELGHTIALVIDPSEQKAKDFARYWNADRYGVSFQVALEEDIKCIHICTPPMLHYAMVRDAINSGKHVICEKPLCLDPAQAKELMDTARRKNLVNAVDFNVRFYDFCKQAKTIISSTDFGRICLIHGVYLQEFHAFPAEYSWRYEQDLAGVMRATTEIGSHWMDLVCFVTGLEIAEISANFGMFSPDRYLINGTMFPVPVENSKKVTIDSEDAAVISIRFSNGSIGNLLLSEVSHGRNNLLSFEITGTKESVWWNSEDPNHLFIAKKGSGVQVQTNAFGGGFPETFKTFFNEVYKDIESNRPSQNPNYPTFYDGYVNSAICAAAFESANNNSKWIKVSD